MSSSTDSDTKICNLALGFIGQGRITSLDQNSTEAKICAQFYEHCRDVILSNHFWNFAQKRKHLVRDNDTPDSTFDYQHRLPDDFLKLRFFNRESPTEQDEPYALEGEFILSDSETAFILYTARITVAADYPPLFVRALSADIASQIAMPLGKSLSLSDTLRQVAMRNVAAAQVEDAAANRTRLRGVEHAIHNNLAVIHRSASYNG